MKKTVARMCAIGIFCLLCACGRSDPNIPRGYTRAEEHFEKEAFQDSVDYCKYVYADTAAFTDNERYTLVSAADVAEISGYFDNFAEWMEVTDRTDEFDFDAVCISERDYWLVSTKQGQAIGDGTYGKYDDYTLYFFDTESCTLYFIHANI